MYRITNINSGADLGAVDEVVYIKIGGSGDFAPTIKDEAIGVALRGVAYNLMGHNKIEGADTVVVSEFDGGALVAEQQRIIDSLLISVLEG